MALEYARNLSAVENKDNKLDVGLIETAASGKGLLAEASEIIPGSAATVGGPQRSFKTISQDRIIEIQDKDLTDEEIEQRNQEAGRVPSIREAQSGLSPDLNYDYQENITKPNFKNLDTDGGILSRATQFANATTQGNFGLNLAIDNNLSGIAPESRSSIKNFTGPDLSTGFRSVFDGQKANVLQAISAADGVVMSEGTGSGKINISVPNPVYSQVMSAATEHVLMNSFAGTNAEVDPYKEFIESKKSLLPTNKKAQSMQLKEVSDETNNAQLGQLIHLTYLRLLRDRLLNENGDRIRSDPKYQQLSLDSPNPLTLEESEVLGKAAKEIWTDNNRDLVDKIKVKTGVGPKTQNKYILTPRGENVLSQGQKARSLLFPSTIVKPLRSPNGFSNTDMGKNKLKKIQGKSIGQKAGSEIDQAIENLESVGSRVNNRRAKIALSTLLPILASNVDSPRSWVDEMYNIGNQKLDMFNASKKLEEIKMASGEIDTLPLDKRYKPLEELEGLRNKLAQELRALAEVREGVFYSTYAIQGFQGRLTPQQTYVNSTTSKLVRFVTSAVLPAFVKRGNRQDLNLRQMYAKALLTNTEGKNIGDPLLPDARESLLTKDTGTLYSRGKRLRQALEMTDAEYETISQAMVDKIPINSSNFPKFGGLNLDPVADEDLISIINKQGEDGAAFIDASIDFANYIDHFNSDTTKPFESYLNAYMDGKTNGPATQGMQMGDERVAYKTGVLRKSENKTQLLDNGDLRNELMDHAKRNILQNPFTISEDNPEWLNAIETVASELYNDKDLAKIVIMTYGYGKELGGSFAATFRELVELKRATAERESKEFRGESSDEFTLLRAIRVLDANDMKQSLKLMRKKYEESLEDLMSELGIESRSLMRAVAGATAVMDVSFQFELPNGMTSFIGKSVSDGYDNKYQYSIQRGQQYDLGLEEKLKTAIENNNQSQIDEYQRRIANEKNRVLGKRDTTMVYAWKNRETGSAFRDRDGQLIPGDWAYGGAPVVPIQAVDAATVTKSVTGKSWQSLMKASQGYPFIHTIYDAFKVDANGYDVVLREVNTNWMKINNDWNYLEEALKSLEKSEAEFKEMTKDMKDSDVLSPSQSAYMNWMLTLQDPVANDEANLSDEEIKALEKLSKDEDPEKVLSNFRNRMIKFNPSLKSDSATKSYPIIDIEKTLIERMRRVGYDVFNPPSQPTFRQLKEFKSIVQTNSAIKERLKRAIYETNKKKSELNKLMRQESGLMYTDPQGYTYPLQYYTH